MPDEGGYLAWLEVLHQLHYEVCITMRIKVSGL